MEHVTGIKAAAAGFFALLTALWGWLGWLVCIWIGCMALDYISGSVAAKKNGQWNSSAARSGLAGKGGMILFVLGAVALDLLISLALANIPGVTLPFAYNMPIAGLVLCWYILTEVGSLFENAEKLGAEWPPFMKKLIDALKAHVLKLGNKAAGDKSEDDETPGQ